MTFNNCSKWTWPYWPSLRPLPLPPSTNSSTTMEQQLAGSHTTGSDVSSWKVYAGGPGRYCLGVHLSTPGSPKVVCLAPYCSHVISITCRREWHLKSASLWMTVSPTETDSFNGHCILQVQADLRKPEGWLRKWGMHFNTDKPNIMSITPKSSFFHIFDTILQQVPQNPFLYRHSLLRWSKLESPHQQHHQKKQPWPKVSSAGTYATAQPPAYLALLRPQLEYAVLIRDPHHKQDGDKLECIQWNSACFSSGDMRTILTGPQLLPISQRRQKLHLVFFYKAVEALVLATPPEQFLMQQRPVHSCHTGSASDM